MDHERQQRELQEVFEATHRAYRAVMEDTLALQKRTLELAWTLLEDSVEAARGQAESNGAALENLAEQSDRQREAVESLIREATRDYMKVLRTPFSHHHQRHTGEDVAAPGTQERPSEPRST
jgi:hypothetical protein